MQYRIAIISPDAETIDTLRQAPEVLEIDGFPAILSGYPPSGRLKDLLDSLSNSTALIFVDLANREWGLAVIEAIHNAHPDWVLAAVDREANSETILAALRAGASEFITPPFDLSTLKHALAVAAAPRAGGGNGRRRGTLLCFCSAQSGNGASTIALHTAHAVATESDHRVLVMELDFHSGSLAPRLHLDPAYTVADMLEEADHPPEYWNRATLRWKGIDLLPAPQSSRRIPYDSVQHLPALLDSALRNYGCVIADLPSSLPASCRDALAMADKVMLVCTPEVLSLHLARRRFQELMNLGLAQSKIHLVVNRCDSNPLLSAQEVRRVVGVPVKWSVSNNWEAAAEAVAGHGLIDRATPCGEQFYRVGCSIMDIKDPVLAASGGRLQSLLSALGMSALRITS